MVNSVEADARGIVHPDAGLARFRLDRHAPGPRLARFVDRYWFSTWDLEQPHDQQVLPFPAVNVVFGTHKPGIHGVATRVQTQALTGRGRVLGVLFRPAGFRPFLGRSMSTITDRTIGLDELFGDVTALSAVAGGVAPQAEVVAAVEELLMRRAPQRPHPCESTSDLVDRIATDPALTTVESLAAIAGLSVRQLQRRFADHVGLPPKTVIRRYRFFEAAERVRHGRPVDWATLAVTLGYSDQAHLTREFQAAIGTAPGRYARSAQ